MSDYEVKGDEPGLQEKIVSDVSEESALIVPANKAVAVYENETSTERLMRTALEGNNIQALKELIALKQSEEDRSIAEEQRQAKIRFDKDFAKMQAEFKPIKRTKENSQYNSKYAELSDLQTQYGPTISKHKFSYDWETVFKEDGSVLCVFLLTKHGYTKRTPMLMPAYTPATGNTSGKSVMNPMQAVGTQVSYGERYSMKAGLGVTETNEDTDGVVLTFAEGQAYGEWATAFETCNSRDELKIAWDSAMQRLVEDSEGRKIVTYLRDQRYTEIKKGEANGR